MPIDTINTRWCPPGGRLIRKNEVVIEGDRYHYNPVLGDYNGNPVGKDGVIRIGVTLKQAAIDWKKTWGVDSGWGGKFTGVVWRAVAKSPKRVSKTSKRRAKK